MSQLFIPLLAILLLYSNSILAAIAAKRDLISVKLDSRVLARQIALTVSAPNAAQRVTKLEPVYIDASALILKALFSDLGRVEYKHIIFIGLPNTVASNSTTKLDAFFSRELMPFLASRYSMTDKSTLVGIETSGNYALAEFLRESSHFSKVLVIHPEFLSSKAFLYQLEKDSRTLTKTPEKRIYVVVFTDSTVSEKRAFMSTVERSWMPNRLIKTVRDQGTFDTRSAALHLSAGLRFVFQ